MIKDYRSMWHKELEFLRFKLVKMVLKGSLSIKEIIKEFWIWKSAMYNWVAKYKKWGKKALKSVENKWWRPKETDNNLTNKEKLKLAKMLKSSPCEIKQLHLDFWLWTINRVWELIKNQFKKDLKRWKVREILIEMWFSNQKPLYRAYQQNPERVEKWKKLELPKIKKEAEEEWRNILYWDEAWFRSIDQKWKTRAPKWETPIVRVTWARYWINAISAISPRWELYFMTYEDSFNSEKLIKFLKKIIYKTDNKYTLILDWHPSHKGSKVEKFLISISYQIKIYHLPPYSPELNPDEQVRNKVENDLKWDKITNKKDFLLKIKKSLFSLQKLKALVQSYFRHHEVWFFPIC